MLVVWFTRMAFSLGRERGRQAVMSLIPVQLSENLHINS
jgi:hypothetical protein